jgi:hypothetical protein
MEQAGIDMQFVTRTRRLLNAAWAAWDVRIHLLPSIASKPPAFYDAATLWAGHLWARLLPATCWLRKDCRV